ncbi:hypothetical protein ACFC34_00465 [Streptomyces sp. NPDC056053]|uniref:hypothetical protein n=1 Tax=Streptomyces sp. NPDC056053 TaxID=3345696 RepID=UPI0035D8C6B1
MADNPEEKEVNPLMEAIQSILDTKDDAEWAQKVEAALKDLPEAQKMLREGRQERVKDWKAEGKSWAEIGRILGVSRQRAQAIADGLSGSVRRKRGEKTDGKSTN